jgi:hypothetical protein
LILKGRESAREGYETFKRNRKEMGAGIEAAKTEKNGDGDRGCETAPRLGELLWTEIKGEPGVRMRWE